MIDTKAVLAALKCFAESVTQKSGQLTSGEPEDQLRGPFETFLKDLGQALAYNVVCVGETKLPGRIGKPDYAVHMNKLLTGYVELKAPGIGADVRRFKGHNKSQWNRFKAIPNLLYSDGNEWGLYRSGEAKRVIRLSGDISVDGKKAVSAEDGHALLALLLDFLQWQPIVPQDAPGLAAFLAPLCRMLRDDVTDALSDKGSALVQLAADWRQLLFPDASNAQFADAYAQTVTFALLLAQSENGQALTLDSAVKTLGADHSLLSRALQVLTDPRVQEEISASLNLLVRVVGEVPNELLRSREKDPWLYFYEHFLADYDPKLRKDAGAYYTPVEVVQAQVRLIDDLLTHRLGKPLGFADPGVVTLDPAVGTGTYLLGVIEHALSRVEAEQGLGAVPGQGSTLARNLYGFEIMVGPYAVAELRLSRALLDRKASLPKDGPGIYLTDTLESPHTEPQQIPMYLQPIADQHKKALKVKDKVPVIVCLGNPPYDRHEAASATNGARTGGWVRWGNDGKGGDAILEKFITPVIEAEKGGHLKNLYNLYVYFWRWALWKVFEHETSRGPGVVSFISASSYLDGDAFLGFREHIRRLCDEIWVLDLGGEGRGTRKTENVFAIQTPVAIAVAVRYGPQKPKTPATVHYAKIEGSRKEKLDKLDGLHNLGDLTWRDCPEGWHDAFRPVGAGDYFAWPLLTELFPWQHSGVEFKRTWPIAPDMRTLERRWRSLLLSPDRASIFRETGDRQISGSYKVELVGKPESTPISNLSRTEPPPPTIRYGYRSFDRQYILADGRLASRPRPSLWRTHGPEQFYLASSVVLELGRGPAVTIANFIPDRHYFAGRGGKDIMPLFRDAEGQEANILPGLLDLLGSTYRRSVLPADFLAYTYSLLAYPDFTARFAKELETRELRVPITKEPELFQQARDIGKRLIWLHTYGQRFVPEGFSKGQAPQGRARCTQAVSDRPENYPESYDYNATTQALAVGEGRFSPVPREVFEFEVSGLKVVKSWLNYRMKAGHGRKSSPLDNIRPVRWTAEFTTELLELLWVLEHTLAEYPQQAELLGQIVAGPLFSADELPEVPEVWRKAPKTHTLLND